MSKDVFFMADSIGELADKIGVGKSRLVATLEEYNTCCDKGYDELFVKDRRYLRPISTPKFYAAKCILATMGTIGGIKINEKTEALNKNFEVIPGLYATGNCAGGLYGDSYNLYSSGGTMGFAINSGRMAGENALMFIGK